MLVEFFLRMGENSQEDILEEKTRVLKNHRDANEASLGSVAAPKASDWYVNVEGLSLYAHHWWLESDFQMKLCLVLLAWLMFNLCLIWICWRKYGDKLSQMMMKEESCMKETLDGKIDMQTEDPLHNKYYPSQTVKIHRD